MWRKSRFTNTAAFAGVNYDSATTAWVNAVVTAGGTVSTTQKGYVDTLIRGLKTDSLFSIIDRMWLLASENTQQANIDIVNLGTWTSHGTITFSANHGYTSDGSSGYLDTNFNPSTAGGNYKLNSAHWGLYTLTSRTTQATVQPFGQSDLATSVAGLLPLSSANCGVNINDLGAAVTNPANANGQWLMVRNAASGAGCSPWWHKNATDNINGSSTDANSVSLINNNFFISARNGGGTADRFDVDQISAVYFGGSLTGTQATNIMSRVNTYHTSLGINVY